MGLSRTGTLRGHIDGRTYDAVQRERAAAKSRTTPPLGRVIWCPNPFKLVQVFAMCKYVVRSYQLCSTCVDFPNFSIAPLAPSSGSHPLFCSPTEKKDKIALPKRGMAQQWYTSPPALVGKIALSSTRPQPAINRTSPLPFFNSICCTCIYEYHNTRCLIYVDMPNTFRVPKVKLVCIQKSN